MTSFYRQRSVFITGATGLLGSTLTRSLAEGGAQVVVLVRDWAPGSELVRSGLLEQVRVVRGDLVDQVLLERVLGEYEIDTVFHLGAQTIVGTADRNPIGTFDSNIRGTWSVLEACRRSPLVKQVLVASSDKAYGHQDRLPYTEDAPLAGRNPYDVSKSCTDLLAQSYAHTYGLPVCITRCGNLYGAGDLNWNRLIPGTIRAALLGERPVIRSDGSYIRDYFYVEDGALACMLLMEKLGGDRALVGEAFNFSCERQQTVLEVVREVLRLCDRADLEPDVRGEARHEIRHQYLDATKARRKLRWRAEFELEAGLRRTIAWYRTFFASPHAADVG